MTKISVHFLARPEANVGIEKRHRQIMDRLGQSDVGTDWEMGDCPIMHPKIGEPVEIVSVTKYLPKSVSGRIRLCYTNDETLTDSGQFDDYLMLNLNSNRYGLRWFTMNIFINYIYAFNCYSATIFPEHISTSLRLKKEEVREKTGEYFDRRHRVFSFHQACYFDEDLCQRAFGMSVKDMFGRLQGNVEFVKVIGPGILIADQLDSYIEDIDELLAHDLKIRRLLGLEVHW